MQWWAIIKLIAGIIANLPFTEQTTEEDVKSAVDSAIQEAQDNPGIMSDAGIPRSEWEELAKILMDLFLWVLKRFGK
jgi:hypothetical protein